MGIILHRILRMTDVSSGPRPFDLTSLQDLFQSVVGDMVSHFREISGLSDRSSSFILFGFCTRRMSSIKKLYTLFKLQTSSSIGKFFSLLMVGKKSPAKFGGISGL